MAEKMKYALRVMALGHSNLVSLEPQEYEKIKKSRELLTLFLKYTENYRIVLDAYERVEDTVHQVTMHNLLHGFGGWLLSAGFGVCGVSRAFAC